MVASLIVVHLVLALLNFLASIVQGIASFGDAVLLQVLWFIVCKAFPDPFNQTPLGDVPVKVVALLMYARVLFSAPYMAYLCMQSGGLFSKSMCLYMAIPSTTCAIIGVYVFSKADGGSLMLFLGISSLIFAIIFTGILAYRYYKRHLVKKKRTDDGAAAAGAATSATSRTGAAPHAPTSATEVTVIDEMALVEQELATSRNASFAGTWPAGTGPGAPCGADSASDDDDLRTIMSLTTGEAFSRREARTPVINEDEAGPNPAPLTHQQLSPTETMTYTRVQINRNLDENGKIKRTTKIAAGLAAAASGIMGSLTGVGAPPQVVFVLWFEVPQYIIRVNFAIQSIPAAVFRFGIAVFKPLFSWGMTPYLINAVLSGYAGVFVGNKLGKLLGPNAFNVFVLMILLLSSLLMVTENPYVLALCTVASFVISGVVTWYERKTLLPKVEQQRAAEIEVYANRPGIVAEHDPVNRRGSRTTAHAERANGVPSDAGASKTTRPMAPASPPPLPAADNIAGDPLGVGAGRRGVKKSASVLTVDSEASSGVGRRVRNAEKFRPPSLFTTPNSSPLSQIAPPSLPMASSKATDVVVVPSQVEPPAVPPSSAALQTEDKPHQVQDDDETLA